MNKKTQQKILDLVKNNYEDIAPDFHLTRKKALWPKLSELATQVPSGAKILDAGCGNGRLFNAFGRKKITYLGVDQSVGLIDLARKELKPATYQKVEFKTGDILNLGQIKDINFDFVFCIAVLHHIPGRDLRVAAIRQLKNKVKKDGKIIISVWRLWKNTKTRRLALKFALLKLIGKNKMDWGDIIFSWKNNVRRELSKRYYHAFSLREFKNTVKNAGLEIKKVDADKFNYYITAHWPKN